MTLAPVPSSRIFVYGTLKRGFCRHPALAGGRFLGECRSAPRYRMVNLGSYPGLIETPTGGIAVRGEIWEVDGACLARLDEVEGVAERLYERRRIQLETDHHDPVEAWFTLVSVEDCPDCGDCWEQS